MYRLADVKSERTVRHILAQRSDTNERTFVTDAYTVSGRMAEQ